MNQQPGVSFAPDAGGVAGGIPTPAPIHDIVGPLPFFSGPLWVIAAVFAGIALLGGLLWWHAGRRRKRLPTPREVALAELALLRGTISGGGDHDFGVRVSDVLRRFLGDAMGMAAPRQTTEEFLDSLRGSLRFVPAEQEALSLFLHRADYLKYARGEASVEQRLELIEAAESFVRGGEKAEGDLPAGSPPQGDVAKGESA